MNDFLKSWIPKLKSYSAELDSLSKLYNQPWVLLNEQDDFVKIIFQPEGKLIVSKNGVVSDGSWQLLQTAQSLLLEIGSQKRLYNHQFVDDGLLIMKLDGSDDDFFVLTNQRLIPDLNVEYYLQAKYQRSLNTQAIPNEKYEKEIPLLNGMNLQVIQYLGYSGNTEVRINNLIPENGFYRATNSNLAFEVNDGRIAMEFYLEKHKQEDGTFIEIGGSRMYGVESGSPVWLGKELAPNGVYKSGWFSTIKVVNGRIV